MAINDTIVTITGNLTADPELKFTTAGVAWVRFSVASTPRVFDRTSESYKDGEALFLTCTAWRGLAENIAESLTKGTRVIVTGRLKQNRWETPEGEKRSTYGLDVDEIGPSLRFATARPQKFTRTGGLGSTTDLPAADDWTSATSGSDLTPSF